jgi:hypothetical protein
MIVKQSKAKQSNRAKVSVLVLVIWRRSRSWSFGDRCGISSEHISISKETTLPRNAGLDPLCNNISIPAP